MDLELYSYWRSSCSWRVRIVLHYKELPFNYIPIHLVKQEQSSPEYMEINPNATVPSLRVNGRIITQSSAIIEYLEQMHPEKSMLPKDAFDRAKVRGIMNLIACDIQPIQNLRVLNYVGDTKKEWAAHFITIGFEALEAILRETSKKYCFGDEITLADAYLVPQVYNAVRWGVSMNKFPLIQQINDRLVQLEAFRKADPSAQIDAQ
jgi:maleylacetoacetate isomerase